MNVVSMTIKSASLGKGNYLVTFRIFFLFSIIFSLIGAFTLLV